MKNLKIGNYKFDLIIDESMQKNELKLIKPKYGDVYIDVETEIKYAHNGKKWIPENEITDPVLKIMMASLLPHYNYCECLNH